MAKYNTVKALYHDIITCGAHCRHYSNWINVTVTEDMAFGLTPLTLVFALLHALLVCRMGCFLPSGQLLVFKKCMEGRRLVSEVDF